MCTLLGVFGCQHPLLTKSSWRGAEADEAAGYSCALLHMHLVRLLLLFHKDSSRAEQDRSASCPHQTWTTVLQRHVMSLLQGGRCVKVPKVVPNVSHHLISPFEDAAEEISKVAGEKSAAYTILGTLRYAHAVPCVDFGA